MTLFHRRSGAIFAAATTVKRPGIARCCAAAGQDARVRAQRIRQPVEPVRQHAQVVFRPVGQDLQNLLVGGRQALPRGSLRPVPFGQCRDDRQDGSAIILLSDRTHDFGCRACGFQSGTDSFRVLGRGCRQTGRERSRTSRSSSPSPERACRATFLSGWSRAPVSRLRASGTVLAHGLVMKPRSAPAVRSDAAWRRPRGREGMPAGRATAAARAERRPSCPAGQRPPP